MKQRLVRHLTPNALRAGLAIAIAVAIPTTAVLAKGPDSANHGKTVSALHRHSGAGKPEDAGKPDDTGKPETAGDRPHNHGWYVSQVARDKSTTGEAHGEAVSTVAQSDQGK